VALGCIVSDFFPNKPKTAKYAGNWDPKSKNLGLHCSKNTKYFLTKTCRYSFMEEDGMDKQKL
jgi:hypothetical protein